MSHQWDEFSKSLSEPVPRRESLRRLGAVFAGAVLGSVGLKPAWAARTTDPCKAFCKCRNKNQQSQCLAACKECNNDPRWLCGNCANGYACTDLASDPNNCGGCFNHCGESGAYEYAACVDGRCEYDCVSGAVRCNGTCTVLNSDQYNCGTCGNICDEPGPNEYSWCENGRCEYACYEGADYCDGTCTFLNSDPDNCGACGRVCPEVAPFCTNGTCADEHCNGADLNWDNSNCGFCGNVCPAQFSCVYGVCEGSGY